MQQESLAERSVRSSLMAKVMWLLASSVAVAVVGAWVGNRLLSPALWTVMLLVEIGLVLAVRAWHEVEGLNVGLLYACTFTTGLTLGPTIGYYVAAGQGDAVTYSLAITGLLFCGLGGLAWITKTDFSGWQGYLMAALTGLLVVSVGNLVLGSSLLHGAINYFGILLFSLYVVYDVQRTKSGENTMGNAVLLTLEIYLDILNLFLFILSLLGSGDDD